MKNEEKRRGRPPRERIEQLITEAIEKPKASEKKEVTLETVRRVEAMIGRSHVAWAYVNPIELVKACREVEV